MLGSAHDLDDVLQETRLRAWRAKETLDDPSRLRAWLYRIATNVCLDELRSRPRRPLPSSVVASADPLSPMAAPNREMAWLEPLPETWLVGVADEPGSAYELREGIALAFVAVLQQLSPSQRAALLLRDVLGFSADEAARALEISTSAANSALFRARTVVEDALGGRERVAARAHAVDEELLAAYVGAYESADIEAFVKLLHDDVKTTMPPSPTWIDGLDANARFHRAMFDAHPMRAFRLVAMRANGRPAFAFYRSAAPGEPHVLRAIHLLETRRGKVARIDHFMAPEVLALFAASAGVLQTPPETVARR
jgi:RNA polymerase sigma-70 factor (ECF subfamily)